MNFNLTTFILELINFLVLMWLLQHFLYKPVLTVIARRQEVINERMEEAESKLAKAKLLQEQYETRLSQWDKEKGALTTALRAELQNDRERQLATIRQQLENERKRSVALMETARQDEMRKYEQAALDLAGRFMAKIFSELAGPELEAKIFDIFTHDLKTRQAGDARIELDKSAGGSSIDVSTAYSLGSSKRHEIEMALAEVLGDNCTFHFIQDENLIAGIKVTAGGTLLQANLQDAVSFFQGVDHHAV